MAHFGASFGTMKTFLANAKVALVPEQFTLILNLQMYTINVDLLKFESSYHYTTMTSLLLVRVTYPIN